MWYRRAGLNTNCFNVWAKFEAMKVECVDAPHLRLLKTVVKSLSYPFWILVYSSEGGGWELERGKKKTGKKKKRQLN